MQMNNSSKNKKISSYDENANNNGLPKDAYLQLNEACNAKCVMCDIWKSPTHGDTKTLQNIIKTLSDLDFEWVTLWGGEPFLHKDVDLIMQTVKEEGMNLQMITNGSLISKHLDSIGLYVDNLVVSIDSGYENIHNKIRGVDIFQDAINGIIQVQQLKQKPSIEIDTTILNENSDTLSSIIHLSNKLGKVFVDFDPVQIYGVGNNNDYAINIGLEGLDEAVNEAKKLNIEITSPKRIEIIKQYLKGEDIHQACYSYCKDMLINPQGDVHTCWTINTIIGNVLNSNFKEQWYEGLKKNKEVLTGEKSECYKCGFSHSRMPDEGYAEIVKQANMKRLKNLI